MSVACANETNGGPSELELLVFASSVLCKAGSTHAIQHCNDTYMSQLKTEAALKETTSPYSLQP